MIELGINLQYRYHYADRWFSKHFSEQTKAYRYLKSLPNKIEVKWIQESGMEFYYFHFSKIYSGHYQLMSCLLRKNSIKTFNDYIDELIKES